MNWLDLVLIGTLAIGGLVGMWTGMVRASFYALGVIMGFVVGARFQADAASWLAEYMANDAAIGILSYAIIISATVVVTVLAARIAQKLVYSMFMGWADRLTGLAVGAAVAGAVVLGMAGLSYSNYSLDDGAAGDVLKYTPFDAVSVSGLEAPLADSALVAILVGAADVIPDQALDIVPGDWRNALDHLQRRL